MPFGYRHTTKSVLTPDELAKADREVLVYGATQTNATCRWRLDFIYFFICIRLAALQTN